MKEGLIRASAPTPLFLEVKEYINQGDEKKYSGEEKTMTGCSDGKNEKESKHSHCESNYTSVYYN